MTTGQTWATFPIWDVRLPENQPSVAFEVNLQFESTAVGWLSPCYNHVHHVLPWKIHPEGSHPKKSKGGVMGCFTTIYGGLQKFGDPQPSPWVFQYVSTLKWSNDWGR